MKYLKLIPKVSILLCFLSYVLLLIITFIRLGMYGLNSKAPTWFDIWATYTSLTTGITFLFGLIVYSGDIYKFLKEELPDFFKL